MKIGRIMIMALVLALLATGAAFGATDTAPLTINAAVNAKAKLTVAVSAINFPDADPATVPLITATEGAITITSAVRVGGTSATLTWGAATNLISGADTIPIGNVKWTATGANYVTGPVDLTLTSATPVTVGTFPSSGSFVGAFTPKMTNSWSYPVGTYAATSTFTLTAP